MNKAGWKNKLRERSYEKKNLKEIEKKILIFASSSSPWR